MTFYDDVLDTILQQDITSKKGVHQLKIRLCKTYHMKRIPSNAEIIDHISKRFNQQEKKRLLLVLQRKPMRTISGVAVVAIMTSPALCPHGYCTPCPGGIETDSPQSYTGFEPAAMRGSMHQYDPFQQVQARLKQLNSIGHSTDKIDMIIMGGTFTSRLPWYRDWFIKRCYDALNSSDGLSLEDAKQINETAPHRCIGLTIETRPDWLRLQQLDDILRYGATRVELGVQTLDDTILFSINRGHTVTDTINATRIAKDAGIKVCYHIMPGLPNSTPSSDVNTIKTLFKNPDFQPDMLKIYPTLVIKNTPLYDQWKKGDFQPLTTKKATEIISKMIQYIPEYVRIQRIQRDVPAQYIDAGVKKSNLRQLVEGDIVKNHRINHEIRFREIGHNIHKHSIHELKDSIKLKKTTYHASNGHEVFLSLSINKHDLLIGYLRLRYCGDPYRSELTKPPCMIIRELKVLGKEMPLGENEQSAWQHQGFGKQLVLEAEKISAEDYDAQSIVVLSGVGVKPYYRKYLGFKDKGIYLEKNL